VIVHEVAFVHDAPIHERPDYLPAMKRQTAHQFVQHLIDNGYIAFEVGQIDRKLRRQIRATVGVVSKETVATLQERIAKHQETVARQVIEDAVRKIRQWGSGTSYLHGDERMIRKRQAVEAVNEALAKIVSPAHVIPNEEMEPLLTAEPSPPQVQITDEICEAVRSAVGAELMDYFSDAELDGLKLHSTSQHKN